MNGIFANGLYRLYGEAEGDTEEEIKDEPPKEDGEEGEAKVEEEPTEESKANEEEDEQLLGGEDETPPIDEEETKEPGMEEEVVDKETELKRLKTINISFNKMATQYESYIKNLEAIDMTAEKQELVSPIIVEYKKNFELLEAYISESKDVFTVKIQRYLNFRAIFLMLNNQLQDIADELK